MNPYSTLQILTSTGRSRPRAIPAAEHYLQTHPVEPIALFESQDPIALLCLRCFISLQIVTHIHSFVQTFRTQYQFREEDLLPIVLDDDGRLEFDRYKPFSLTILEQFKPSKGGNLTSLTIILLKQHRELELYLLKQHGYYRRTAWGLLNETKPHRLPTLLTTLSDREITDYQDLLTAYRAIYLADRVQTNQRKTCQPPTEDQLTRIATKLAERSQKQYSPKQISSQLQSLADHLRKSYIDRKSGLQSEESLDPNLHISLESHSPEDDSENPQTEFLTQYRTQFSAALTTAIATTIDDRTRAKPKKAEQFLAALKINSCDRLSMIEIAPLIGLPGQDRVSRLIDKKALRSDIRRHLLLSLKSVVFKLVTPADLVISDRALEIALEEEIDPIIQEDAKDDKTPKTLKKSHTRLSIAICKHLDGTPSTPENSS